MPYDHGTERHVLSGLYCRWYKIVAASHSHQTLLGGKEDTNININMRVVNLGCRQGQRSLGVDADKQFITNIYSCIKSVSDKQNDSDTDADAHFDVQ